MKFSNILPLTLFAALLLMTFAPAANAYIDPGSGSYAFQFLAAGFLGGIFAVRVFWSRLLLLVQATFRRKGS